MRRIFPSRYSSSGSSSSTSTAGSLKPPQKKEKTSAEKDGSKKSHEGFGLKKQQVVKQGCSQDKGKREHWCPSCPSGTELRCETPPSGDENISTTSRERPMEKRQAISHTRLGLPEECQDKQVLRPSMKAISRGSSPERGVEWTSGLQDALDQLVAESRQELTRNYVSEPPSPASSPPLVEKRRRHENYNGERPGSASSDHSVRHNSLRLLPAMDRSENREHPTMTDESAEGTTISNSMDFDRNSYGSSSRLSRSLSRSSNDGASILSNPRSHSFSDWSRGTTSDNFSHRQYSVDDIRDKSNLKYLSARTVAEKLVAKVIRKSKDPKRPPPFPHTPTKSSESTSNHSSNRVSRATGRALEQSMVGPGSRLTGIDQQKPDVVRLEMENDFSRIHRDAGLNFVYESLDERVLAAEKLVALVEAESTDEKAAGRLVIREVEKQDVLIRKIKKLQKERKELAREVVSEVRLRSMERVTIRDVLESMRRSTELWIRSLERDKAEMQAKLENNVGESWLRERVKKIAGEKDYLEKELASVTSKENALRQKVREFELQMQAHVARVEDAETTILELRDSVATGQKRLTQWEQEGERLRANCREKERENVDLRKQAGRLRQLSADREKSIQGLWESLRVISHEKPDQRSVKLQREILRLSELEQSLRQELENARSEASMLKGGLAERVEEATSTQFKVQMATLHERVKLLSDKLSASVNLQRRQLEEIKALEEENHQLKDRRDQGKDSSWLEKRVEIVEMVDKPETKVMDVNEDSCDGERQQVIDGLQKSLSDMTHALNTQNSRIQRLTGRNEELNRLHASKEREVLELQAKLREAGSHHGEARQVQDKLKRLQDELYSQQSHCKTLKEKLSAKELELEQFQGQLQGRLTLNEEVCRLKSLLASSNQRVIELESQVREKENKLSSLQAEMKQHVYEVARCRQEMSRLIRERDEMNVHAEEMSREALRSSAEAEVLKRRVNQLEEDIMLKEGQLSILRNSLDNEEV